MPVQISGIHVILKQRYLSVGHMPVQILGSYVVDFGSDLTMGVVELGPDPN
jgi:hypothetical protein